MLFRWLTSIVVLSFPVLVVAKDAEQPFCEGKYVVASEMLDAAYKHYGTLYSGGNHFRQLDDVGATVDLYRLWRGLPDLKLRSLHRQWKSESKLTYRWVWGTDAAHADGLRAASELGTRADWSGVSPDELRAHIVRLDLATVVDTPPDWWKGNSDPNLLTERSRELIAQTKQSPFLDWLQFAATASDRRPEDPAFERLSRLAQSRFDAGGGLEWAVVANALYPKEASANPNLNRLGPLVERCGASTAEFAAFVAMTAEIEWWGPYLENNSSVRSAMPEAVRRLLLRRFVLRYFAAGFTEGYEGRRWDADGDGQSDIRAFTEKYDVEDMAPWLAVAYAYFAIDEASVIGAHQDIDWEPKSVRAINLMSVNGLIAFARSKGINADQRASLLRVAFARAFALKQEAIARSVLPDLKQAFPIWKEEIEGVERSNMRWEAKLAAIAMALPELSTGLHPPGSSRYDGDYKLWLNHGGEYLDIPKDLALGFAVQGDAETWWKNPSRWDRYHGMHGTSDAEIARKQARRNSRYLPLPLVSAPRLFERPEYPRWNERSAQGAGIARWAAIEETSALVGSKRLSNRLADVLIDCADHPGRRWFRYDDCRSEIVAKALHRFVTMRRGPGVDDQGVPNGKRAFEALYRNFPESEWTRKTKYWYQ